MGTIFSTPARQAWGWTVLGLLGIFLAAGGVWLATGGEAGDQPTQPEAAETASPTATLTPSRTSTPAAASPTPTVIVAPTESPSVASQPAPAQQASNPNVTAPAPEPEATEPPTAEPTPEPVVQAGGPYCPSTSATAIPTRVFGTVTIAGAAAPAGTVVTLAFDGAAGPGEAVAISGGTAGYSIDFNAAQGACANRVGAAIGLYVNGEYVASGQAVGGAAGQAGFIRFDVVLP